MDFSKIPLFQGLVQKMGWLAQRQQVLARNIANANTPGFKPKDIEKPDFSALLEGNSRGSGKASVISWIWVSACRSEMMRPTSSATSMIGAPTLSVTKIASRATSRTSAGPI